MSRPLRDRLGEAIRRCRVGMSYPPWDNLPENTREDYRRSADQLCQIGKELGIDVSDARLSQDRAA